jgi:nicotinamidase/pyrazinamidase
MNRIRLRSDDALVVVDMQNDFVSGSLAVPGGGEIVAALNRYVAAFRRRSLPVIASRDWHPADHCSFRDRGGPWPPHCVAGTAGARFVAELVLPADALVVSKATRSETEAYSAFAGTDLDAELRARGVGRIFIGGLATDYCVLNTVRDARRLGYAVCVLGDATRAVDVHPGDGARAVAEMRGAGAIDVSYDAIAGDEAPEPGSP